MKPSSLLLAAAATLASGACNAEKGGETAAGNVAVAEAVQPPANGDWSTVVAQTAQGGFRMGNPEAKVQLVEFGSMTCPHCAEFDEEAIDPLIQKYVKNGQVAFEFRNFVRDPFDIAASLIARCNGSKSFFPLTSALFEEQRDWIAKLQALPQAQLEGFANLPPERQFVEIAKAAGLQQWAAMRGVPTAKSTQCLTDQNSVNQLVQMNSDTTTQYPEMTGTPSFLINGELVEIRPGATVWQQLETRIRQELGS